MSEEKERPLFKLFEKDISHKEHHVYLSCRISSDTERYDPLFRMLDTTSEDDAVTMHINCPGGCVGTGIQILNAMKQCKAPITTIVESTAHSMATYIFLAGDDRIIRDNSIMLFHNYASGSYGKGAETAQHVMATGTWMKKLAEEYYTGFLTDDELEKIALDQDFWLFTDDVRLRLEQLQEHK